MSESPSSIWYYEDAGQRQGPVDQLQIEDLIRQGTVQPDVRVWTSGMEDWEPAAQTTLAGQFISSNGSTPPPLPSAAEIATWRAMPFRDLTNLSEWVYGFLMLEAGTAAIAVWSGWLQLRLLNSVHQGALLPDAAIQANDVRELLVGLGRLGAILISLIVLLRWVYFAHRNLRAFRARELRFSPGWAVGYYFVPILNLWRPYQVMKEIWQASEDPWHWRFGRPSLLLPIWWTIWIVSMFADRLAFRQILQAESTSELINATQADLFSNSLNIIVAIVTGLVVHAIQKRQTAQASVAGFVSPSGS